MRVANIIKILILTFAVLASVNIAFLFLSAKARDDALSAKEKRYAYATAAHQLQKASADLSRWARVYVVVGGDFEKYAYHNEVNYADRIGAAFQLFFGNGLTPDEMESLQTAFALSDRLRAIESAALDASAEGNKQLATDLLFGETYTAYGLQIADTLDRFYDAMVARTQEATYRAIEAADLYRSLVWITTVLFALVSVSGAFFLLREVNAANRREREAQALNQMLLDSSPIFIEFWDKEGNVIDCSRRTLELFGLSDKAEFIGRYDEFQPALQPCGTPSPAKVRDFVRRAFEDGYLRSEWMHLTAGGELLPVESIFVRLHLENRSIVVVYNHDLREVKKAMEKISKAEERAKLLIEASPTACFLLDSDCELVDSNLAAARLFVKTPNKSLINENPAEGELKRCECICDPCIHRGRGSCLATKAFTANFYRIFPQYYEGGESAVRALIRESCNQTLKHGITRFFYDHISLYGETISCEVTIVRVKYQEGEGFACYQRDIRNEKLREQAEEDSRAKTRFLARMSHEIRTPMNAVLGITEIQLQKEGLSPETEEAFLRIHSSSNLLLTIINDILDLSQIEVGKMEIVPVTYEITSMIVDTVQLNLMYIGSKNVNFELHLDENLPTHLTGDDLRIRQILNNVLSNAFKYTHEGTVSLSFGFEGSSAPGDDLTLVITVRDTGQGMTREQVDSLFGTEFNRFNLESNRTIEGSGLGMTIAHHLAKMMGGDISVESKPGKGSVFTVRLPQKSHSNLSLGREAKQSLQNLEVSQRSLRKLTQIDCEPMPYGRVLAVDDVESNLHVIKGLLLPYKIAVEAVESGAEAVARVSAGNEYDIIFMDHMMPVMDGLEATRKIRALHYSGPIIALTANTVKGSVELFMNSGFSGFISKPIDLAQLNAYLTRFIRDKQPPEVLEAARMRALPAHSTGQTRLSIKGLARSFLRDAEKAVKVLEPIISERVFDEAALKDFTVQVHGMKSALLNIGRSDFSKAAQTLELAGREGDVRAIEALAPSFLSTLKEMAKEIAQEEGGEATAQEDPASFYKHLLAILDACESYNIEAADCALHLAEQLAGTAGAKTLLREVSAHLLRGDFEEAGRLIDEWSK